MDKNLVSLRSDGRLGLVEDKPNFSLREIKSLESFEIPESQQMILVGSHVLEGELQVEGEFVLDEFLNEAQLVTYPENFSFHRVASQRIVEVPRDEQMFVVSSDFLDIEGELRLDGALVLDQVKDTEIDPVILPDDNFSFKEIASGLVKTIPQSQQMIVDGLCLVEGELRLEGSLSVIDDERDEPLQPYMIVSGEVFKIKPARQLFSAVGLIMDGYIENEGLMAIGA